MPLMRGLRVASQMDPVEVHCYCYRHPNCSQPP